MQQIISSALSPETKGERGCKEARNRGDMRVEVGGDGGITGKRKYKQNIPRLFVLIDDC